ncbi:MULTISPECIES: DUF6966 domain-containing protein [Kordiimonas]|jgi:hypothetical protein|uniref:DUF6966 domain-containing protein n=1 Tax=Kordiimonas TaxID=288021 RepID=UPI00257C5E84|nr:hypothetical protein [Kordiimonas sp. UBA4487]
MTVLVQDLLSDLGRLSDLLNRVKAAFWASKVNKAKQFLDDGHHTAASEEMRSWFGGMGSLNDLVIHPVNGHAVSDKEMDAVNAELANLKSSLFIKLDRHLRDEGINR